jgi:hypothetical protein
MEGQRARTCFNCGDKNHFVADCHFERREDNGGRLIRKYKSKSLNNGYTKYPSNKSYDNKNSSNKNYDNKNSSNKKPRAFVTREEYSSDDDDDEKTSTKEDEEVTAIATTTPSISLFDAPNENSIINSPRYLMAKVREDYTFGGSKWVLDSGATNHMTGSKDIVVNLRPNTSNTMVSYGDKTRSKVMGLGKVVVNTGCFTHERLAC